MVELFVAGRETFGMRKLYCCSCCE